VFGLQLTDIIQMIAWSADDCADHHRDGEKGVIYLNEGKSFMLNAGSKKERMLFTKY